MKMSTLAKDGKSLLQAVDYCRSQSIIYSPNMDRSASVGDNPSFQVQCSMLFSSIQVSLMNRACLPYE